MGPGLYYELRYESLIAHPQEECGALCAFLGLSYDDAMLRFNEEQLTKKTRRPVTAGLRDWRTEMSTEDVDRFEAAAGSLLDELGYPRAFPHPRPESLELAVKMSELLTANPMGSRSFGSHDGKVMMEKATT